jgi:uncharacterized protein
LKRETFIDELRGFALLGIAIANAPGFAFRYGTYANVDLQSSSASIVAFFVFALITTKFYSIFSFLFGYSVKFTTRDFSAQSQALLKRRLSILAWIGVAHGCLLFFGEIVLLYVIFGWVLLRFLKLSDRALWVWAISLSTVVALVIVTLTYGAPIATGLQDNAENTVVSQVFNRVANGSFREALVARSSLYFSGVISVVLGAGPQILGLFLIGIIAARQQWFLHDCAPVNWVRSVVKWTSPVTGLIALLFAWVLVGQGVENRMTTRSAILIEAVHALVVPLLALCWIFFLQWLTRLAPNCLILFRLSGRCSLSCYVLQSVFFATVFSSWGWAQYQRLTVPQVLLVSVAVWAFTLVAMQIWSIFFKQGPLEMLVAALK